MKREAPRRKDQQIRSWINRSTDLLPIRTSDASDLTFFLTSLRMQSQGALKYFRPPPYWRTYNSLLIPLFDLCVWLCTCTFVSHDTSRLFYCSSLAKKTIFASTNQCSFVRSTIRCWENIKHFHKKDDALNGKSTLIRMRHNASMGKNQALL